MDKNIFNDIAETFTNILVDNYDSGLQDMPKGLETKKGFLQYFKNWLQDESKSSYTDYSNDCKHVLKHFDEVDAEEFDPEDEPGKFIPVLK